MNNNGSYTMMAKPMETLELHYPMIQFLITQYVHVCPGDIFPSVLEEDFSFITRLYNY